MAYSNYCYELYHKGLNRTKIIKAATQEELIIKVAEMRKKWDAEWNVQQSVQYANRVTSEANQLHIDIDNILTGTLPVKILNFEGIKNYDDFSVKAPLTPKYIKPTARPEREDEMYNPSVPLLVRLSKKRTAEFVCKCDAAYKADLEQWNKAQKFIKAENAHMERKYKQELEDWNKQREEYSLKRDEYNKSITEFSRAFFRGEKWAVEKYIQMVLEDKRLPFMFDRTVDVEYDKEEKLLIIDLLLPAIEEMPNVKSYSYIKARSEYKETHYSESDMKKKHESVVYQMILQAVCYAFFSINTAYLSKVAVNGKIKTIDKATGKNIEPYISSITVNRDDFEEVEAESVDPKYWFKSAKGVSAAILSRVTPVEPIIKMSREDKRFINGYSVVEEIDEGVNLAAMDWQDFENLIREIFEDEFNSNGGEVKITRASRDGGVDAIAFDPDPIRGGKIVIQAKRYTNVVGVSAVRDLYGTVIHEGATRGILVTTSDYGRDAHSFASGKPITLLNGSNLLALMSKHGHKVRIDIEEARRILKAKN